MLVLQSNRPPPGETPGEYTVKMKLTDVVSKSGIAYGADGKYNFLRLELHGSVDGENKLQIDSIPGQWLALFDVKSNTLMAHRIGDDDNHFRTYQVRGADSRFKEDYLTDLREIDE